MKLSRHLLSGVAAVALVCAAAGAHAEDATPVPAPPAVQSTPLAAPAPKPAPQAAAPAATPTAAAAAPAPASPAPAPKVAAPARRRPPRRPPQRRRRPRPRRARRPPPPPPATRCRRRRSRSRLAPKPKRKPKPGAAAAGDGAVERPDPDVHRRRPSPRPRRRRSATPISSPKAAGRPICRRCARVRAATSSPSSPAISNSKAISSGNAPSRKWDGALDRRDQAFPGPHGAAPDRHASAGETLKAINVSAEARRLELAASAARLSNLHFDFEQPLRRRQPAVDRGRGGAERPGRASLCRHRRRSRPSLAGNRRACLGHQPQPDLDGADLDHQERDHPAYAARSRLSQPHEDPRARRAVARDRPALDQLEQRARRQLHPASGFRAPAIRSARSASACRTSSPSTCTTRPARRCSAATSAS